MMDGDAAELRNYIEAVVNSGGRRLPPEPKLSAELGISRGRLRTLLKRLENERLIWRHVGKGTFVGPRQLVADVSNGSLSISVDDIIDARLLLEPRLAAQAAIRSTPADLAAMDQCIADMKGVSSFLTWKRLDERLHRTIAEATHNAILLMVYDTLRSQVKLSLDKRMEEVFAAAAGPKELTEVEHCAIVDAIRQHNPAHAEHAMREHLESVRRNLFGLR
ncbi:FadR/GntR family transcriptional regulator [Sphingomonas sp. PB4P5]|uniref:FadR/GntR family transcriptional regulator n=1 Tax=Parasphingomonas puruogangriensis TaxID=3096155 RepID=UPI002FCB49A4